MADRFYLPAYLDNPDRQPVIEDLGTHLHIVGAVYQGMGSTLVCFTPSGTPFDVADCTIVWPTLPEWGEIIKRTDDPEVFVGEVGGVNKVLHRKVRYAISGEVQQRVWVRDDFSCVYCGAEMGKVLLTIDHWMPLELGGANDDSNYVTACKKCNKRKGMMHPREFCEKTGHSYEILAKRLAMLAEGKGK